MLDTVKDFRLTLEQEKKGLTGLCELWNSKLVKDKTRISDEIEVRDLAVCEGCDCVSAG